MVCVKLESEMLKHRVKVMTVRGPLEAKQAYDKLLSSLPSDKFVGVDCEGIVKDKLALMIQVREIQLVPVTVLFVAAVGITAITDNCPIRYIH